MKKTTLAVALGLVLGAASVGANAALVNGSTLNIGAGSFFVMEVSPGFFLPTNISGNNGVVLGTAQAATGSHSGAPNGSESPGIDAPWNFFGNTGMHQTTSAANVISASGNTATVNFSGWSVTWNGIANIPMGNGAWNNVAAGWSGNTNGVAQITCGVDCGNGDTYTLQYTATVPLGDPSNFGGVHYGIKLTGTISAIPVPAAVWLLGSGLLGLVGVARRRKALVAA